MTKQSRLTFAFPSRKDSNVSVFQENLKRVRNSVEVKIENWIKTEVVQVSNTNSTTRWHSSQTIFTFSVFHISSQSSKMCLDCSTASLNTLAHRQQALVHVRTLHRLSTNKAHSNLSSSRRCVFYRQKQKQISPPHNSHSRAKKRGIKNWFMMISSRVFILWIIGRAVAINLELWYD